MCGLLMDSMGRPDEQAAAAGLKRPTRVYYNGVGEVEI